MCIRFVLFPDVARHLAVFVLEALGEIAGSRKADGVCYLADALVGGEQQLVGSVQTGVAQYLHRRRAGDGLYFAVELHPTEVHIGSQVFNADIAISQTCLNNFLEAG